MKLRGAVQVLYQCRLGNNLAQYCIGRILAEELGFDLQAPSIPGFPNVQTLGGGVSVPGPRQVIEGHRMDLDGILADCTPRRIIVNGFFQRYEYYQPYKSQIRDSWLIGDAYEHSAPDDLTIHVRAGDVWQSNCLLERVHPDYHTLPFSFYDTIIRSRRWGRVTVVTEDRYDPMVQKLVARFDAEVRSGNALEDFNILRASSNLVLSVSSYSWWAGWLSDARQIYFPVAGFFDQERARRRPVAWQQDLWVDDEPRYIATRPSGVSNIWTGTEAERQRLLNS